MMQEGTRFIDSADQICQQKLRSLFEYWKSIDPNGGVRHYGQFDPLDIDPRCLPLVTIFDAVSGSVDFRFRLVGTHIDDFVGASLKDILVSESPFRQRGGFVSSLQAAAKFNRPCYCPCIDDDLRPLFIGIFGLWLPMSKRGGDIDMVVGGIYADRGGLDYLTLQDLECSGLGPVSRT